MTGKELILYILENDLENVELFSDDFSPLLIRADRMALKWECGEATIKVLVDMGKVKGVKIGDKYYVFASEKCPFTKTGKD